MRKTVASLTLGATVLAGAAGGAVLFQPGLVGAQEDDATEQDAQPDRRAEARERIVDALAPLVEDGTIDDTQAGAVADTLADELPLRHRGGPRGLGPRGFGGIDAVLDTLGVTGEELRDALAEGQSIGEIAEANGVDPAAVVDAIVARAAERLDDAVAEGDLDRAEADEKLAELTDRAEAFVAGEIEFDRPGPRGPHRGGGFGGGPFGGGDATDDDTGS